MADQTSTVIIDVTLNQQDALARAKELNNQVIQLKDNQDKLKASGAQLGTTYKENAQSIRQLESETKAYIALSKNEEGSINSLRAQITLLTNQFNALSKSERETGVQGQALTKQLKALNEAERAASQSGGNFKTSVATYGEAIRGATQNMLPFGSETARAFAAINSLSGAFKGVSGGLEVFKTALASTGVGLLILGVASLVSYLKDLDAVTDGVSQQMGGLKGAFVELGRSILNLDFKALFDTGRFKKTWAENAVLIERTQDLEDRVLAQSVKSANAQAKVSQLRAEAMNRALDPKERQKLLAQAEQIDAQDLDQRKKNADSSIELATESIEITGKLTDEQAKKLRQGGVDYALYLQNNLVKQGKVTDAQTKTLADALKARDQIQNEYTLRSEKRNNLSERIAMQADAKQEQARAKQKAEAEKQARALEQIDADRQQSLLYSSQSTLTIREKEYADINLDIDKRKKLYQKYNQDTTQLEVEREAKLVALRDKFHKEDIVQIQKNLREVEIANLRSGKSSVVGGGTIDEQVAKRQSLFSVEDVDKQIEEIRVRIQSGEETVGGELTTLMSSLNAKRQSIIDAQSETESIADSDRQTARIKSEHDTQNAIFEGEKALSDARIALNETTLASYEGAFQTIAEIAGKNSAIGKAAFVIEKGLAIARVILNAQVAKSNINIAASAQIAAASEAAIFTFGASLLAIPAIIATAAAQIAAIDIQSGFQIGAIAATTIAEVVGFSKGGYVSGKGSGTSDSIPARLSNGESVINAKSTKMFAPLLSDINVAGGGHAFAGGGLAGSYVPNISQQVNSRNAIATSLSKSMRDMKPVVYVESIADAIAKQEVLVENANF